MMNAQELLKNTVILTYTLRQWGNRAKADNSKIEVSEDQKPEAEATEKADKNRLRVTKKLIESKEYDEIIKFQNKVRAWLKDRSVPSFFKDALVLVKVDMVQEFEKYLIDASAELSGLVDCLVAIYPEQKEAARKALTVMYNERDYPVGSELSGLFGIEWNWIELNVSENLPNAVREKEAKKLQDLWDNSITEIIKGLRTGFKELVDHAVDRLTVKPGEKPKVFKDTLVPNFMQFLETFSARNVVNDYELENLVKQAKGLLEGITTKELRDDTNLRNYTASKFAELKKTVDESVVSVTRKFDFTEK